MKFEIVYTQPHIFVWHIIKCLGFLYWREVSNNFSVWIANNFDKKYERAFMDSLVLTNFVRSIYMLGQIDPIETVSYFLSELLSI
jgi:hypothetical protein